MLLLSYVEESGGHIISHGLLRIFHRPQKKGCEPHEFLGADGISVTGETAHTDVSENHKPWLITRNLSQPLLFTVIINHSMANRFVATMSWTWVNHYYSPTMSYTRVWVKPFTTQHHQESWPRRHLARSLGVFRSLALQAPRGLSSIADCHDMPEGPATAFGIFPAISWKTRPKPARILVVSGVMNVDSTVSAWWFLSPAGSGTSFVTWIARWRDLSDILTENTRSMWIGLSTFSLSLPSTISFSWWTLMNQNGQSHGQSRKTGINGQSHG